MVIVGTEGVVVETDGVVVTVSLPVVDEVAGADDDVVVEAPPGGTAVTVDVDTDVDVEVDVALAGAITPHATRLPASPVASVSASGPPVPFWV